MARKEKQLKASDIEKAVLDSYFSTRQTVYDQNMSLIEERKTTLQVMDDLSPILTIEDSVIVDYMLWAGYMLIQDGDGSPVWQMWRLR